MTQRFEVKKAVKYKAKGRMAIMGPSGSGKTYTALEIATEFIRRGWAKKIAVIDSEHESSLKYADIFQFDHLPLESYSPDNYSNAIKQLVEDGYDFIIIDSLSHAWTGKDGALEQVDNASKRANAGGNKFTTGWREVTPMHNNLIDTIIGAPAHIIATMRVKMDYVIEEVNGKKVPRKIGLAPVQRDGMEYEFDVVADMNISNELLVGKTRCPQLAGKVFNKPGADIAKIFGAWLEGGAPALPKEPTVEEKEEAQLKALMADVELIAAFETAKAPEAKRVATLRKYNFDKAEVLKVLAARVAAETEKKA